MRILHVTGSFLPVKGGGPYFVHHLSRHLEAVGHECTVVTTTMGGTPAVETVETVRARSVTVAGAPIAPGFPATLARTIRRTDPDMIHANYPLPGYPDVAAVLAAWHAIPCIITCHGAFEMSFDSLAGVVGTVYNRSVLQGTLRVADRVHVSHEGVVDQLSIYEGYREKLSVVPMGVDLSRFDRTRPIGEPPYPASDDRSTILYVGAFRRYKGLETLLRAMAALRADRVEPTRRGSAPAADAAATPHLILIGDGPRRDRLVSLADELGLAASVTIRDHVDDDTLRAAYAHADVFVLPSPTIAESFGLVALEALAMGVPTVVTAGSGVGHVLADERAGVVVPPNDPAAMAGAIGDLLDDEALYDTQRTAGPELVRSRFAWDELVTEYETLYDSVR